MYNKEPTGKQPGFLHPIPKFDIPMHTIHIDHLGPCVTSARKNTHLILAIDGFTKFAFLKAVRNTSVGPVLTHLDEIFSMFGVAQRIIVIEEAALPVNVLSAIAKRSILRLTTMPRQHLEPTGKQNGIIERF
jgi:hypothetical protein